MAPLDFLDTHPFVRVVAIGKARGTILGSALGDALGLYTEFLPKDECLRSYPNDPPIVLGQTQLRADSHRDKFLPGSWTDDTDHTLLLLLAYLHNFQNSQPFVPSELALSFASRLHIWCNQGLRALETPPLGLGLTIGTLALSDTFTNDPKAAALEAWKNASNERKPASNGSVMRTSPLGVIALGLDEDETFKLATTVCHMTHVDPRTVLTCVTVVGLLRGIIRGDVRSEDDVDALLAKSVAWVSRQPELVNPGLKVSNTDTGRPSEVVGQDFLKIAQFDDATSRVATLSSLKLDSQSMGYVYTCLGAGVITLRAAMRSSHPEEEAQVATLTASSIFKSLMTDLVLQGGDADTNAVVAGALLGAWFGGDGLPQDWLTGLRHCKWLESKTARLIGSVGLFDTKGDVKASDTKLWWETKDPDADPDGGKGYLNHEEIEAREKAIVYAVLEKKKQRDIEEKEKIKVGEGGKKWFSL